MSSMPQEDKNKVLFIAGAGRSGSTLLEILLGQIEGVCATGELRFIWKRSFGQNQLCGCGKPFKECEFWGEVVAEAFGGFDKVDHKRLEELRLSANNHNFKKQLYQNRDEAPALSSEYIDAFRELFRAIKKVSGCEFIVDSTKIVAPHGYILASIPELELYTVHLARDSRAVAYSWQREKVRPEVHWEKRFMSRRGILKSTVRWNSCNALAHQLQFASKQYAFLKYEDLVSQPEEILTKLLNDLCIEPKALDFLDGPRATLKPVHTVSGNPARFLRDKIVIRQDAQWQMDMAKHKKWLVTLLTMSLLSEYGYIKNGKGN